MKIIKFYFLPPNKLKIPNQFQNQVLGIVQYKRLNYLINSPILIYKILEIKSIKLLQNNNLIKIKLKVIEGFYAIKNPSIAFFFINKYLAMIFSN